MTLYHTILDTDNEIIDNCTIYATIYSLVDKFVNDNNLLNRTKGGLLSYWVNIKCGDKYTGPDQGYFFETSISDNIIEKITTTILKQFYNQIKQILENNCTIELQLGL